MYYYRVGGIMFQISEQNRPKCVKCDKPALCFMNDFWICGICLKNYQEKLNKDKLKAVLEE
jgi:hypothetical protein